MKLILSFFIFSISLQCFSTVQHKDLICYDGINYELKEYYLEEYFNKNPAKRPKNGIQSSSLWRGYVALFTVFENKVYLTDLLIKVYVENSDKLYETTWKSVFNEFSPNNEDIFIDWIDDLVLLPLGDVIDYEQGFGISFNDYNLLEIKKGQIINSNVFSLKYYRKIFKKCHVFLRREDLIELKKS